MIPGSEQPESMAALTLAGGPKTATSQKAALIQAMKVQALTAACLRLRERGLNHCPAFGIIQGDKKSLLGSSARALLSAGRFHHHIAGWRTNIRRNMRAKVF
jgi:hypothetical protein